MHKCTPCTYVLVLHMHSTSTGALIFMLTCMYIPCPVHLCYSPVPSLGSVYSQLGQLLQQTSVECGHPGVRLNAKTSQTGNNIELCCNKYTPNFHLKTISQCGFTSQPSWSCFNGHPRAQIYCTKVKLYRYQTVRLECPTCTHGWPCQSHQGPCWTP